MFEYWSWKERAVVIGLATLAAVLAVLVYMGMQKEAELQQQVSVLRQKEAELQQQISILQQENAELQRQVSAFQQKEAELQRQISMLRQKEAELLRQVSTLQQKEMELQQQISVFQQKEAELQRQISMLRQENAELQQQISMLQERVQSLSRFEGAFPMYAEWRQQGQHCVPRLNILANPGVWDRIRRGNGTGGGYYAILRLVDSEGQVLAPGVLRFTVHDPEVWFRCDRQVRAVAVEQAQFERRKGFFEYAVLINNTLKLSRFTCDGLCGLEAPLARPIRPLYVDVLVVFYPPGVDGYARIPWDYGYAARIPVR